MTEDTTAQNKADPFIPVLFPKTLRSDKLPAQRFPLGVPDDYKPCIALLPSGELLMVAFHSHELGGGKLREEIILFRSTDGGVTWSQRQTLDLLGREPYLTVLRDGTVLMTVHLLAQDIRNKDSYAHSYLHRSTDGGRTWTTMRIGPDGFRPKAQTMTSRNVLELPDGTLVLAVDSARGRAFMWRSTDGGETWDRSQRSGPSDFKSAFSHFAEAVLWRAKSGRILSIVRVDSDEHPIAGRPAPGGQGDQRGHMVLFGSTNNRRSMKFIRMLPRTNLIPQAGSFMQKVMDLGDYGEMYPSVLRLKDGHLLLTFTVRALKPPLGVQAVLGVENDDGFVFDFEHDRLVLDSKTPRGKRSGGGFGPTIQLADETLVTAYSHRGEDDKTHVEVTRWRLPK